jgi:predicted nuclease with TOPRIM domain
MLERTDRIEERLDRVEMKVDRLETKFDRLQTNVDGLTSAFDSLRSRVEVLNESSVERFNNLYDLLKSQADRTDARFEQIHRTMQAGITSTNAMLQNHERRLVVLEGRRKKA